MAQLFGNNGTSTIPGGVAPAATSLVVATGEGTKFPAVTGTDYMHLTITQAPGTTETAWEIVKCTAHTAASDTFTITKGQEGTTDAAWAADSRIELRVTAAPLTGWATTSGTNTGDQTTVSGSAGSVVNAVTFATTGGATSGASFDGSAVKTIDYATVGAAASGHTHSYQAADADLLAIGGLTGTSGYLKKTAADTWTLDASTFATGSGTASGTNTGDNSANTLYSGLVTNATHTGDATGATALTVVKINGVSMAGLATGILKNTTTTGVPSIAAAGTDYVAPSAYASANGHTMSTAKMLGRATAGSGAAEEIATTGTGSAVLATSPTLVTPVLGTITSGDLTAGTNAIGYGLKSATTTVAVSAATAPTNGQVLTATSSTTATWQAGGGNGTGSLLYMYQTQGAL